MGYTTDFSGSVAVEPPLNAAEIAFLTEFAETRRMHRRNGPLYAQNDGDFGQSDPGDVIDGNRPHPDQPGLWCQWVPVDDGHAIEWDGGEKFYESAAWMKYIVEKLLAPSARRYIDAHLSDDIRLAAFTCDHVVNGRIEAQGEDSSDQWVLIVENNIVKVAEAVISFTNAQEI